MVRNRRNSRPSALIAAWLVLGQTMPWGATAALASNPAASPPHDPRRPYFAIIPLPSTAFDARQSNEPALAHESAQSSRPQEDMTAEFAQYFAAPQSDAFVAEATADPVFLDDEEELPPTNGEDTANENSEAPAEESEAQEDEDASNGESQQDQRRGGRNRLDPQLVQQGQNYFEQSCTACHDAERATSKRKTVAGWMATVRRMAAQEDADIPADQHRAIATYLASLNPAYQVAEEGEDASDEASAEEEETDADAAAVEAELLPFTLNGTLSPVYRGTETEMENRGFFPDVWLGIEWRPQSSPVSGKVVACASCHGSNTGLGVELVEAAATLDLFHLLSGKPPAERPHCKTQAELSMGRFVVPFGAFSGRAHPGALRTVSLPLMYNMGRRVGPISLGQPVIPLPYADEGANLHLERELPHDWDVTLDTYAVNGLQFGGPSVFFFSRSYQDNNSNVAVGGRATIGNDCWRFGGSIAGGELQNEGDPLQTYSLAGGDVSYRNGEFFRAYYEYAIREEDSFPSPDSQSIAYGNLIEAEVLLFNKPKISFLARYDTLEHRGALGQMSTERITYGLNWVLPGGSLLILDHEHWIYDVRPPANIFGLRWTTAF
jgi:hypothetical protein